MTDIFEKHLIVYKNRSEYISAPETKEIFEEGVISEQTKRRNKLVKDKFEAGFLENIIVEIRDKKAILQIEEIDDETKNCLELLVDSVTSEVGRALIGLTVMQLCIKSIEPNQSIRLHKGGVSKSSFSWQGGISMRTLDKNYVTPALRKHDLLRLNADGFMMTRSLAENYPYSLLYKAQLRGARDQWLAIVESLESGVTDPLNSLKYFISLLFNKAEYFQKISEDLIISCNKFIETNPSKQSIVNLIKSHINDSDYAARLMEISMHSLLQAALETGSFDPLTLKPLSQMRSANKKHGNVGDIELLENNEIIESWDAKYGKAYLRDEIDEVMEKVAHHTSIDTLGFVTTMDPIKNDEIQKKIADYEDGYGVKIQILTYDAWVAYIFDRVLTTKLADEEALSKSWLLAYVESLAQKRREIAPIDEPCIDWVTEIKAKIELRLQ
jgi:hypothetical protein